MLSQRLDDPGLQHSYGIQTMESFRPVVHYWKCDLEFLVRSMRLNQCVEVGAGEGNRTLVIWLGTRSSTIELRLP